MSEVTSTALQETEIEYTFLARAIPEEIKDLQPAHMEDTYFPEDPTVHAQLRVRRKDESYVITKKVPVREGDALAQIETSIPITRIEYESIASGSQRRIEKDRYRVSVDGYPAEVDVFRGVLEGLVLIDFEFRSPEERDAFIPPTVCGANVTNESFLAAGELSGRTYDDIARDLGRLGYLKLEADEATYA